MSVELAKVPSEVDAALVKKQSTRGGSRSASRHGSLSPTEERQHSLDLAKMTEVLQEEKRKAQEEGLSSEVAIPLPVLGSKGFIEDKEAGVIEKILCGCFPYLMRIILCAAIGSFLFGFNIALLNTSIDTIASEFGWCETPGNASCHNSTLLKAFVTTGVFIGAALGAMTGGRFLFIGRRRTYLLAMIVFLVGVISSVTANSFSALLWARLIVGYGVGVISLVVPIYMSEVTPPQSRGAYGVFHQLFITIGIFVAVLIGLPLMPLSDETAADEEFRLSTFDKVWWRVMLGLGIVPVFICMYFLVFVIDFETPHYYVENDRVLDAEKLLKKINKTDDVDEALAAIVSAHKDSISAKEKGLTFFAAMKDPMYRHVILLGCVLSAFQQLSGINVFVASSNRLFRDAGLSDDLVTIMSIVLTFVNLVMTFPAIYLIEKMGRRSLMLLGTTGMTVGALAGTIALYVNEESNAATWTAIGGSIVFIMFFSVSYGPVLWVYLFEIYPIEIKGVSAGLATAVNWIAGIVMVFVTSFIAGKINFLIFAITSFISVVVVFFFMRETKGLSLEESPYMTKKAN